MTATELVFCVFMFLTGQASGAMAGVFLAGLKPKSKPPAAEAPSFEADPESLRLARQYENIMNYDGTERGQMRLED